MKLKAILFGAIVALSLTACSNDNPDQIDQPVVPSDKTTLNVLVNDAMTKSDADASAVMNSLQVLVFNATQYGLVLEKIGKQDAQYDYRSEEIEISAGRKAVLVIANYPQLDLVEDAVNGTPITEVLNMVKDFEEDLEVDGALTMNSRLYKDITVSLGKRHYLGFPVVDPNSVSYEVSKPVTLFRNVARIRLASVHIMGDKLVNSEQYPGLVMELQQAYILHAKEMTMLVGQDGTAWGSTSAQNVNYINGYPGVDENNQTIYMRNENAKYTSLLGPFRFFEGYNKECRYLFDLTTDTHTLFDGKNGNPEPVEFYVYENPYGEDFEGIQTLLVLKVDFSYVVPHPSLAIDPGAADSDMIREHFTRYYTVAVGEHGFSLPRGFKGIGTPRDQEKEGQEYWGIYRNLQYNVHFSIQGEGYIDDKGDKGQQFLQAKVEVAPWGEVDQYVIVE
ncbi:fimbrial protein [Parabacteroides sp. PF5-6]|uniref:fimbrial protein n=1 Tax=Parabacteroides sp. PF5-6 TaxID=1742403 RepID=UPI0024049EF0|nr:fimbrial protein [Parabacteroides sp. PF5-6]MDF9829888.1 hypothetical protein [Parabacteroides sp. PF5-6]